ncbi:MAG: nickel pincer cofactor biosynthesis protein LarC [Synergistaceae bacterium]|nr:nickel pincer cofactor biosynthesis protein LarC [Synergistaceae bacterium]
MDENMRGKTGKIIMLNASAGISGDMFLGAMCGLALKLDASFDLGNLLSGIALDHWEVSVKEEKRGGFAGVKVDVIGEEHHRHVHDDEGHPHRRLSDIEEICAKSNIPERVRASSLSAFRLLAEAEAEVHGMALEDIHFHETGAVDSIVDIMGSMLITDWFGWPEMLCSPVNVGSGSVKCAHGILPVPAPATAILLKGVPVFSAGAPMERTTPTGALLLRVLVRENGFRPLPEGRIVCASMGLGGRDTPEMPNALGAVMIDPDGARDGRFVCENIMLLEANIDDMNPQDFSPAMERLFAAGALDVWCENILMKKGRPAVKFCCLSRRGEEECLAEIIARETTTIGVRIIETHRMALERSVSVRTTPLGDVRFKSVKLDGEILRSIPEYDDIRRIAAEKGLSMLSVRNALVGYEERDKCN